MSETQLFPQFLPKQTRFLTAENPSPTKFSGTFAQLETAFSMLESFLGNGVDYHVTKDENRKMLFNISSAIGRTDKLYKPMNLIPSLQFIDMVWGLDATAYNSTTGILDFPTDLINVGIPVNAYNGYEFGVYYNGAGQVFNLNGLANTWVDLPDTGGTYKWVSLPITGTIRYLKIKKASPSISFSIKSMYAADPNIYDGIYNKAYALPLENNSYWTIKTPCIYSSSASGSQTCERRTCEYCIGHSYDFTTGQPKCFILNANWESVGDNGGAYWLNSGTRMPITYTPVTDTHDIKSTYFTVQSPLLTKYNQYAIMYKPFHMHNETLNTLIPPNQCIIYDTENSSATMKYLTNLFSAGGVNGSIRGDIFYIQDTSEVAVGEGNPKRYIVLGGNYGFLDLIYDILGLVNLPVPVDASEHVAVYDN
jgi:hypothetical protein